MEGTSPRDRVRSEEEEEALRVTKSLLSLVILTEGGNKGKVTEGAPVVKKTAVKKNKFDRKISLVPEGDEDVDD